VLKIPASEASPPFGAHSPCATALARKRERSSSARMGPDVQETRLHALQRREGADQRRLLRREFARCCAAEGNKLLKLPTHPDYTSQAQLRTEFRRLLA